MGGGAAVGACGWKLELIRRLFIGVVGPHRSTQVAEAVSISNRRLVLLLVRIRRILMKNTVGENFLRWSRLPAGDDNTDLGGPPAGLRKNWSDGPWLGYTRPCGKETKEGAGWADRLRAGPHTGKGKGRMGWAGSRVSWVSAHYRVGVRKILFFFKSFYNLQTNLNPIQIWISAISIRKIKYKNTSPHKEKYTMTWMQQIIIYLNI
jgi:hypothetical protein